MTVAVIVGWKVASVTFCDDKMSGQSSYVHYIAAQNSGTTVVLSNTKSQIL